MKELGTPVTTEGLLSNLFARCCASVNCKLISGVKVDLNFCPKLRALVCAPSKVSLSIPVS